MYIFDTSSLKQLFKFYPKRFPSLWQKFGNLMDSKKIISVKEVLNEIENYGDNDELKIGQKKTKHSFKFQLLMKLFLFLKFIRSNIFSKGLKVKNSLRVVLLPIPSW
jgi:hypothetical protein